MSDEQKKKPSSFSRVARLSGIGMQMAGTIFIFAMIGKWLDEKYPSNKKWFTDRTCTLCNCNIYVQYPSSSK